MTLQDTPTPDGHIIVSPLRWVRLSAYCQQSGDTPAAVHQRRKRDTWTDGIHCQIGPDGNLWVNLVEVNRWVEGKPPLVTLG